MIKKYIKIQAIFNEDGSLMATKAKHMKFWKNSQVKTPKASVWWLLRIENFNKFLNCSFCFCCLIPNTIIWEDGRNFSIDKILSITNSASVKYGAMGKRYICKVHGKEISLFNEENKWFIEQS